jgi:hypothetical protein
MSTRYTMTPRAESWRWQDRVLVLPKRAVLVRFPFVELPELVYRNVLADQPEPNILNITRDIVRGS